MSIYNINNNKVYPKVARSLVHSMDWTTRLDYSTALKGKFNHKNLSHLDSQSLVVVQLITCQICSLLGCIRQCSIIRIQSYPMSYKEWIQGGGGGGGSNVWLHAWPQ